MAELFANGAKGRLDADISAGAVTLPLRSGQGALFPAYGAGDYSWLVLEQGPAIAPTKREIIQVTARSVDSLTVARAQQGTSALPFERGARVEMRTTARTFLDLQEVMGFNRKFPSGGMAPEATSTLNQYGAFDGVNPAAFTRVAPSTTLLGYSQPRLNGTRIAANASVPAQNALGTAGAPTMLGGMEFLLRFTFDLDVSGTRKYLGISSSSSATFLSTLNPSALASEHMIGIGHDDTSSPGGLLQLFHNAGVGPVTVMSTGINRVLGHLYQMRIWSPRGVAKWYVELLDFDAESRFFQPLTSNVPVCGTVMYPTLHSRRPSGADDFALVSAWSLLW